MGSLTQLSHGIPWFATHSRSIGWQRRWQQSPTHPREYPCPLREVLVDAVPVIAVCYGAAPPAYPAYSRRLPSVRFLLLSPARLLQVQRTRYSRLRSGSSCRSAISSHSNARLRHSLANIFVICTPRTTQYASYPSENKMIANLFPTASPPKFVLRIITHWPI